MPELRGDRDVGIRGQTEVAPISVPDLESFGTNSPAILSNRPAVSASFQGWPACLAW